MGLESGFVSDEFRDTFNRHVDGIGKNPTLTGEPERNLRVGLYI